jgi:prepilin-type N-terminal cleavage/methylation domain-containing protein
MKKGFTLIELLVVIAIIGVLTSVLLTNMVGIRSRAADVKRKNDLKQFKTALRLYYNDFQHYPLTADVPNVGTEFNNGAETVYMKQTPPEFDYYSDGGEGFLLRALLENASDQEAAATVARCNPADRIYYDGGDPTAEPYYFVCED